MFRNELKRWKRKPELNNKMRLLIIWNLFIEHQVIYVGQFNRTPFNSREQVKCYCCKKIPVGQSFNCMKRILAYAHDDGENGHLVVLKAWRDERG